MASYNIGDRVAYASNRNQTGTVTRIYPEGVTVLPGYGIDWDADDIRSGIFTALSLEPADNRLLCYGTPYNDEMVMNVAADIRTATGHAPTLGQAMKLLDLLGARGLLRADLTRTAGTGE